MWDFQPSHMRVTRQPTCLVSRAAQYTDEPVNREESAKQHVYKYSFIAGVIRWT